MEILQIILYAALPLALALGTLVYKKFPQLKQDNKIEETIEDVLHHQTGFDIDISPDTPEKK